MPSNTDTFLFVNSKHMRTSDGAPRYGHFRYFRPFILRCGISRTCLDRMSNFSTPTAYAKFGPRQWYPFISPVFWCLGQRATAMSREPVRNPIISLAGCHVGAAVTRQVFSFIVRIGEAFFLPAGPWDQTGFHRRGAVTEYTPIPKLRSPSRGGAFRAREMYFSKIDLPKKRIHFASTQRFVTHFAVAD